jgi:carbohydrate-selective porin OprB
VNADGAYLKVWRLDSIRGEEDGRRGDNKYHGVDFGIRHNSGVAVIHEVRYRPKKRREAGYPGFIKIGGLYDSEPRPAFSDDRLRTNKMISSNWMIYGIAQQKLYHTTGTGLRQLTAFATITYAPPSSNTIQYFPDAGLVYIGLVPNRENDAIGLFGILGEFSNDLRVSQRQAHVDAVQTQEGVVELTTGTRRRHFPTCSRISSTWFDRTVRD